MKALSLALLTVSPLAVLVLAPPAASQACALLEGPDLIAGDLNGVANYSANAGYDALSFGTAACNLGDVGVGWVASTNQHPVMGSSLYRLKDHGGWWGMEHVGRSWLMHGFFALSQTLCCSNCTPTSGSTLGPGCTSPNSASRNGSQSQLGPSWEVNAFTGVFPYPPSNPSFSGSTARRLEVALADLEPTGSTTTRYFGELHFVAPDDAQAGHGTNNASYREVLAADVGGNFNFALLSSTARETPAIQAWADSGVDPNVKLVDADVPGEGHLVLGCSVTQLDASTWHYEYALYNMNSDVGIRSFRVPVGAGAAISDAAFHGAAPYRSGDGPGDVAYDDTAWTIDVSGGAVTFEVVGHYAPPGDVSHNALRWSSTMNFRFDANVPPVAAGVELVTYKTESGYAVTGVQGPGDAPSFCDDADGSLASCPCGNPGSPDTGCDVAQATGGVRLDVLGQDVAPNRVTWQGSGFPAAGTPAAIAIRAPSLDPSAPVAFGDGLRCVGTPLVRLGAAFALGGSSTHVHGHGAGAGPGTFHYQLWFRNTPAMYCTPDAFNLSNGRSLVW